MPKILLDLIIPAKLQGTEIDAAIPAGGGHVLLLGLLLRLGLGGDGGELGGVGQVGLGLGLVLLGLLGLSLIHISPPRLPPVSDTFWGRIFSVLPGEDWPGFGPGFACKKRPPPPFLYRKGDGLSLIHICAPTRAWS